MNRILLLFCALFLLLHSCNGGNNQEENMSVEEKSKAVQDTFSLLISYEHKWSKSFTIADSINHYKKYDSKAKKDQLDLALLDLGITNSDPRILKVTDEMIFITNNLSFSEGGLVVSYELKAADGVIEPNLTLKRNKINYSDGDTINIETKINHTKYKVIYNHINNDLVLYKIVNEKVYDSIKSKELKLSSQNLFDIHSEYQFKIYDSYIILFNTQTKDHYWFDFEMKEVKPISSPHWLNYAGKLDDEYHLFLKKEKDRLKIYVLDLEGNIKTNIELNTEDFNYEPGNKTDFYYNETNEMLYISSFDLEELQLKVDAFKLNIDN